MERMNVTTDFYVPVKVYGTNARLEIIREVVNREPCTMDPVSIDMVYAILQANGETRRSI